jgi:hypothetical protein
MLSIQYNKLRKRIKVYDVGLYKPDDIAYHLLGGQTTNLSLVNALLALDGESFNENLDNANNILDLNHEVD